MDTYGKSTYKKTTFVLGLLTSVLFGCKGEVDPESTLLQIEDLNISDPALKVCLEAHIQTNSWTTVDEVTHLNCAFTERTRMSNFTLRLYGTADAEKQGINDLSGIELFTALRELNLDGNYFAEIDLGALTELKELSLASSFISHLDVSRNTKLESLNITSTAITSVNLTGLRNLKKLYGAWQGTGFDPLQQRILNHETKPYGDLVVGEDTLQELIIDNDAVLEVIEIPDDNFTLDLENSSGLVHARGQMSSDMIERAYQLQTFSGKIGGSSLELNVDELSELTTLEVKSDTIETLRIPTQLRQLMTEAPITNLISKPDSELNVLVLESNVEVDFDWHMLDIQDMPLQTLVLRNYFIGRVFDLSGFTQLTSLTLDNSYVDLLMYVPESLQVFIGRNRIGSSLMSPQHFLKELSLTGTGSCTLLEFDAPALMSLHISGCSSETIDISKSPALRDLSIVDNNLSYMNLENNLELINITLDRNNLANINLDAFIDLPAKGTLSASENAFSEENKEKIRQQAESIFSFVYL